MADVRMWCLLKEVKLPAYNQAVRQSGLDLSLDDSMLSGKYTDGWTGSSWNLPDNTDGTGEEKADELVTIMEARGPHNVPGPECQASSYRSDEGANPPWTNALVLDDLTRKPDALQVKPFVE